jgi:hypothetical protein
LAGTLRSKNIKSFPLLFGAESVKGEREEEGDEKSILTQDPSGIYLHKFGKLLVVTSTDPGPFVDI